ncbi:hypothetical protein [Plantactinospora veratri]
MESLVDRPIADYDLGARARAAGQLPPLLVVQDRKDREVDPADGVTMATAWPGRLHRTTGLGHARILADPEVVRRVVDFVHHAESENENGTYVVPRGAAGTGPAPGAAPRNGSTVTGSADGSRLPGGATGPAGTRPQPGTGQVPPAGREETLPVPQEVV